MPSLLAFALLFSYASAFPIDHFDSENQTTPLPSDVSENEANPAIAAALSLANLPHVTHYYITGALEMKRAYDAVEPNGNGLKELVDFVKQYNASSLKTDPKSFLIEFTGKINEFLAHLLALLKNYETPRGLHSGLSAELSEDAKSDLIRLISQHLITAEEKSTGNYEKIFTLFRTIDATGSWMNEVIEYIQENIEIVPQYPEIFAAGIMDTYKKIFQRAIKELSAINTTTSESTHN